MRLGARDGALNSLPPSLPQSAHSGVVLVVDASCVHLAGSCPRAGRRALPSPGDRRLRAVAPVCLHSQAWRLRKVRNRTSGVGACVIAGRSDRFIGKERMPGAATSCVRECGRRTVCRRGGCPRAQIKASCVGVEANDENSTSVVEESTSRLVEPVAPWCGPCRRVSRPRGLPPATPVGEAGEVKRHASPALGRFASRHTHDAGHEGQRDPRPQREPPRTVLRTGWQGPPAPALS